MQTSAESPTATASALVGTAALVGAAPRLEVAVVAAANDATADIFDSLAQMSRMIAGMEAMRAQAIDTAIQISALSTSDPVSPAGRDLRLRSLRAELACAMRIPERTAEHLMHASETLVRQLPATLDALAAGRVSYRHAQAIVDETATLEPDAARAVEDAALPFRRVADGGEVRPQTADAARAAPSRVDGRAPPGRGGKARGDAHCGADGMAWLSAYLPAAEAAGAFTRLTDMASSLRGAGEPRTLTQLRADLLVDLLHNDGLPAQCGVACGIRPTVQVAVPVLALLGTDLPAGAGLPAGTDLPAGAAGASLDGYGPIDEVTARRLAGSATKFCGNPGANHTFLVGMHGSNRKRVRMR